MGFLNRWVDARVRAALDHVADQLDNPESKLSRAVGEQTVAIADRVADRLDESLGKVDEHVGDVVVRVRQEVRETIMNLVPDAAAIAGQLADQLKNVLGLGFLPRGAPFGPGGPGVQAPEYREPEAGR